MSLVLNSIRAYINQIRSFLKKALFSHLDAVTLNYWDFELVLVAKLYEFENFKINKTWALFKIYLYISNCGNFRSRLKLKRQIFLRTNNTCLIAILKF